MHINENITRHAVAHEWPLPRKAAHAIEPLIKAALDAGRDMRPGRRQRADGWRPERIRMFLEALAEHGSVTDAARAARIAPKNAYALRKRASDFDRAWQAALSLVRPPIEDAGSRVRDGYVVPVIRKGRLWGYRHRHDNRLGMSVLTKLDRKAASMTREQAALVQLAAEDFDALVEFVCADAARTADLIRDDAALAGTSGRAEWQL